jgi:hypothetical protein
MPSFELENFIKKNRKPTFSQVLFKYIDKKGTSDSTIYKKLASTADIFLKYVPMRVTSQGKILLLL